jgi:hypothetical protein
MLTLKIGCAEFYCYTASVLLCLVSPFLLVQVPFITSIFSSNTCRESVRLKADPISSPVRLLAQPFLKKCQNFPLILCILMREISMFMKGNLDVSHQKLCE